MDYKQKIDSLDGFYPNDENPQPTGDALTEAITDLENEIGQELPDDYKTFLIAGGGVACIGVSFEVAEDDSTTLDFFYGLTGAGEPDNLADAYERFKDRLSSEQLPVARDEGGNQVLLNLDDGTVLFFDHEVEGTGGAVSPLADDLDSWLESLSVEAVENEEDRG